MNRPLIISKCFLRKKIATLVLVTASVAAFATLGDGGKQKRSSTTSVLLPYSAKNFSLRSNYNYKSNTLFSAPVKKEYIMLNPVITLQKGNAAYIVPLKKMPLLGKFKFSAAPQKFWFPPLFWSFRWQEMAIGKPARWLANPVCCTRNFLCRWYPIAHWSYFPPLLSWYVITRKPAFGSSNLACGTGAKLNLETV